VHLTTGSTICATLLVFTARAFVALVIIGPSPSVSPAAIALLAHDLCGRRCCSGRSSIGKEAWMTFAMSVAAPVPPGGSGTAVGCLALGLFGTFMVRPRVSLTS
jgi:hypothetical protein